VLDHCVHIHRRLAAVPAQFSGLCLRRHQPRTARSGRGQNSGLPQLVSQSSRLRAHVETLSCVTHPGETNKFPAVLLFVLCALWSMAF